MITKRIWIISLIVLLISSIKCSALNRDDRFAVLKGKIVYSNGLEKEGYVLFPDVRPSYMARNQQTIKFKEQIDELFQEVDINALDFIYVRGKHEREYLFVSAYWNYYGRRTKTKRLALVSWINESCFLTKAGKGFYFPRRKGGTLVIVDPVFIMFGITGTDEIHIIGNYNAFRTSHEILTTLNRNWKRVFRRALKKTFEESCPEFYKLIENDKVTIERPLEFIEKYQSTCGN